MPTRINRIIRLCICLLCSILLHVIFFHDFKSRSNVHIEAVVVEIQDDLVKPADNPDVSNSQETTLSQQPSQADTAGQDDEYKLGTMNVDNEDSSDIANTMYRGEGLPDCKFVYGSHWPEIVKSLNEISVIYVNDNIPFIVMELARKGIPQYKIIDDISLREYLAYRGSYFIDKAKNRKEEFDQFPPIRDAFQQICRDLFSEVPPKNISFVGFMEREHMLSLKDRIKSEMAAEFVSRVLVNYSYDGKIVTYDIHNIQ
ncbi:hypothetical protein ACFL3Q_03530 [Planctomycetota bacterium]